MLYFIAVKHGFMMRADRAFTTKDIRCAHPFTSFQEAEAAAKNYFPHQYFAVLANCIGQ